MNSLYLFLLGAVACQTAGVRQNNKLKRLERVSLYEP